MQNNTFIRGATYQQVGQISIGGLPQDCTGWTIQLQVSTALAPVTPIATLTIAWIDQTQGIMNITSGSTSNWPVGKARIDAVITDNFGTITPSNPAYFRIGESPLL